MRRLYALIALIGLIIVIQACSEEKKDLGPTPEPPVYFIDSVYPADGEMNVSINTPIIITFLRPMDTSSLTADRFYISGGHGYSFSGNDSQAVIYPNSGLTYNSEYRAIIRAGISDTIGNTMLRDYNWTFYTEMGNTFLESTYPINTATHIPINAVIRVTFSGDMNPATINGSTFLINNGVTGTVVYSDRVAEFTPDNNLVNYQNYTVTLKASIATAQGALLGNDYTWSFKTIQSDIIPPTVDSVVPANGAVDVQVNSRIKIIFSERIRSSSIVASNFTVDGGIDGNVSIINNTMTFAPSAYFLNDKIYTASYRGPVADIYGNSANIDLSWSFTTAGPPEVVSYYPNANDTNIPVDTTIQVIFTNDMLMTSFTSSTFAVVDEDDSLVAGMRTYINRKATFWPSQPLLPNHTYRVYVTRGIKGISGLALNEELNWSFTTESAGR